MVDVNGLKTEIIAILEKVAKNLNITDYKIEFNIDSESGNGFLGEFFMGYVIEKGENKKHPIAIKKASKTGIMRQVLDIPLAYKNENAFYSKVFPALDRFQKKRGVKAPFDAVPKYFFGSTELFKETVVMENIIYSGFQLHEKSQPLSSGQIKVIFETYGKFHALSYAYKDQRYEEYKQVVSSLKDYYYFVLREKHDWDKRMESQSKTILNYLKTNEFNDVAKKFAPMAQDIWDIYREVCVYKGDYSALLHGDCWSNNMMYKYDAAGNLRDIRMLDFQLAREASPVYDLSYCLYSSSSKEQFNKLDHYLDIYYQSFSDFVKELGSDPQKIYPKEELIKEWKNYAKFGIIMAFSILGVRERKREDIAQMATGKEKLSHTWDKPKENKEETNNFFCESAANIVIHACEYGIL